MSYNGIKMSKEEFKNLKDLAVGKGLKTIGEFEQFIEWYCRAKSKQCQSN